MNEQQASREEDREEVEHEHGVASARGIRVTGREQRRDVEEGRGEDECCEERRRERPPAQQQSGDAEKRDHHVRRGLDGKGPQRSVDGVRERVVREDPGQRSGERDEDRAAQDVQVGRGIGEVRPQRERREDGADHERGEDHGHDECGNETQRALPPERHERGRRQPAARDEEPADREEHRDALLEDRPEESAEVGLHDPGQRVAVREQDGHRGRESQEIEVVVSRGGDVRQANAGKPHSCTNTDVFSRYADRPSRPCSRPMPLDLKPPNGAPGRRRSSS